MKIQLMLACQKWHGQVVNIKKERVWERLVIIVKYWFLQIMQHNTVQTNETQQHSK